MLHAHTGLSARFQIQETGNMHEVKGRHLNDVAAGILGDGFHINSTLPWSGALEHLAGFEERDQTALAQFKGPWRAFVHQRGDLGQ